MINLNTDARLNIILPNMNKALGEAIKNATPEQLEMLKEGKDISSFLTTLFNDKLTSAKSDSVLSDILKNSTLFKNMGNLTDNLSLLIKDLNTSSDLSNKSAVFENFLKTISTIDPQNLKHQLLNSGIFMESKLAHALQRIPDLTQNLEQLHSLLAKSSLPQSKTVDEKIINLLQNPHLPMASTHPQSSSAITEALKDLRSSLKTLLSSTDPLYSKEVKRLVQELEQHSTLHELKSTLSQLYGSLLRSNAVETNTLLDSIEKLLKTLSPSLSDDLKIFTENLKNTIHSGDITKECSELLKKMEEFANPKELLIETSLKESMQNDLKSNLFTLSAELKTSDDPNANKLLEQVDKLLTQIDYHQLTSYLNTSNSLYFPFYWDQLQEGYLTFKKTPDKKFYCQINLHLKEYGELNLMMGLYEENQLEIRIHTEKEELQQTIQEHLGELRSSLIDSGIYLRSIRVLNNTENHPTTPYVKDSFDDQNGFEVMV